MTDQRQLRTATARTSFPIGVITTDTAITAFIDDVDIEALCGMATAGTPRAQITGLRDRTFDTMAVGPSRGRAYAGVAKRDPHDKLDLPRGRALALARLLRDIAADLEDYAAPILAADEHRKTAERRELRMVMTIGEELRDAIRYVTEAAVPTGGFIEHERRVPAPTFHDDKPGGPVDFERCTDCQLWITEMGCGCAEPKYAPGYPRTVVDDLRAQLLEPVPADEEKGRQYRAAQEALLKNGGTWPNGLLRDGEPRD